LLQLVQANPPNKVSVACCVIIEDPNGAILLQKRAPGLSFPNSWVFAGGRLDPNETLEECAKREVKEEVGLDVDNESADLIFGFESFGPPVHSRTL